MPLFQGLDSSEGYYSFLVGVTLKIVCFNSFLFVPPHMKKALENIEGLQIIIHM